MLYALLLYAFSIYIKENLQSYISETPQKVVSRGAISEIFIGLELMTMSDTDSKAQLFYWHKEAKSSTAEEGYIIELENQIIPIEVKSGKSDKIRSLRMFLEQKKHSKIGIKFSTENFSFEKNILKVPLYAVSSIKRILSEL